MIRRPPSSTLFPYTPLSRSLLALEKAEGSEALSHLVAEALDRYPPDPLMLDFVLLDVFASAHDQRALLGVIDRDRKSTRLNSSHSQISYAVFCLKKKTKQQT